MVVTPAGRGEMSQNDVQNSVQARLSFLSLRSTFPSLARIAKDPIFSFCATTISFSPALAHSSHTTIALVLFTNGWLFLLHDLSRTPLRYQRRMPFFPFATTISFSPHWLALLYYSVLLRTTSYRSLHGRPSLSINLGGRENRR